MSIFSNTFTPVAIGFLLLAAGQSALASQPPCNKRLYERASIACHGNGNCIARTYFQSDFNVKAFMQCKADQWNQMFGDNKTVDELFNSKNSLPYEPISSKALDAGTYSTQPFANSPSNSRSSSSGTTNYNEQLRKYRAEMEVYEQELKEYNKELENDAKIAADPERAIIVYDNAIALNPRDFKAFLHRGLAKENLRNYEGAIDDHSKAIALNPDHAPAYYSRGVARQKLGDFDGALSDYNSAIEHNPYHHSAYSNRAIIQWELKRDADAACRDIKKSASLGLQLRIDYLKSEDGAWCRNR